MKGDDPELWRFAEAEAGAVGQPAMHQPGQLELLGQRSSEGIGPGQLQRQPQAECPEGAAQLGREVGGAVRNLFWFHCPVQIVSVHGKASGQVPTMPDQQGPRTVGQESVLCGSITALSARVSPCSLCRPSGHRAYRPP